ncbi:hypothetical protein FRC03_008925 [Tulasnella sp. 419]|nr:hypothetical protein FRC03_008925 [Tulasnella sp. 419]
MASLIWRQLGRQVLFGLNRASNSLPRIAQARSVLPYDSASINGLRLASTRSSTKTEGTKSEKKTKAKTKAKTRSTAKKSKDGPKARKKPATKAAPKRPTKKTISKKSERLYPPPPRSPPLRAAQIFIEEEIERRPKPFRFTTDMPEIWVAYNKLSETEKQGYKTLREKRIDEYKVAFKEWEDSLTPEAREQYNRDIRIKKAEAKARNPLKDLKKPTPPFLQFSVELGESQKLPFQRPNTEEGAERARKLKELWDGMTLGEKAPYVAKWQQAFKEYEIEKTKLLQAHLAAKESRKAAKSKDQSD